MKNRCRRLILSCLLLACFSDELQALTATSFFPSNNATAVCADTPLKITFDAAPAIGTSGSIKIYNSGGTLVETLDLAVAHTRTIGGTVYNALPVLVTGNSASIFPRSGVLAYNTTCYVTVDAAVFPGFAGVTGTSAWRFTTKSAAPSSSGTYFTVAADGTGDFCTVQGAIDLIPAGNLTKRYINVRNGIYQEIVRVPSKHNLTFRGQNRKRTIISYPNNNSLNANTNTRPLFNVAANDVSFDSLTLHNTTPDGGSQAEALRVNAQRCVVNNCDLRSFQDTFLVNSTTDTAYFKDSLIEGDADFIWGTGRAVFQGCEIKSLDGGFVCAMRNPAGQHGAVFLDCRFTRSAGVTGVVFGRIDPNTFPDSAVAVVNCAADAHITALGWTLSAAGPTTGLRFWEYQSTDLSGAPLNVSGRASFSSQINSTQATALRNLSSTFGGWTPIPPLPAFPGAEGAGANTLGGRGGDLYFVTNLNDSGAGSLRDGINTAPASGRTILFKVSGTIALNSNLTISKPRITIAGQSAPGGGVCLKNWTLRVDANDIVIRHIRSRLGTDAAREDDAITVWNGIYVILDHCSASWSVDEVLSCTGKTDNLTTQWCHVTEALDNSIHSKGPHGYGSIVASYLPARLSWHHNLYAHNQSRNPRPGSYDGATIHFDFRNNVLYNWGFFCGYSAGSPEAADMNYVGNYLVKGPGSTTDSAFRGGGTSTRIFQSGNKIDLNKNAAFDGTDTGWSMFSGTYTQQAAAFDFNQTNTTETADLALQRVLSQAGAMPWNRDAKDSAIAANVAAGTGDFVDNTTQAGGYPTLASTASPPDNDLDGLPNNWESAFGSDLNVANHNADADVDGYTDLEEYLNWLAAPHATTSKDETVDIDLIVQNGNRTGLTYTVSNPVNGTVTLLPDGRTARFTPTPGFQGLGSFTFSFTTSGQTVVQTVGVAITTGRPNDLTWTGTTATWDVGTTANFTNGASTTTYTQGDNVSFLQTGSNPAITVSGTITPTTMTVNAAKNYSFSGGTLSGTMNLIKAGSGTLTINAANAYTGGTAITGGTVVLGNAAALGTGPVSIDNAGLNLAAFTLNNPIHFTGTNTIAGAAFAKLKAVSGDGTVSLNISSSPFDLSGDMTAFAGTLVLTTNTNIRLLTGTSGAELATFDLGSGTGNITVRNNIPAIAIGALQGGSNTVLFGQSNDNLPTTFTIGGNGEDCTFSGGIRNGTAGASAITSVTKTGAGIFTLAGTSNYTGSTLVNEGTLRVTGALGATTVTVADGAFLAGSGNIGGSVVVQTGGNLSSGSGGAGTLAITGGLTLNGTPLSFDLGNSTTPGGGVNDLISIGGALTLNGTITVTPNLLNGPLAAGTYTLVSGGTSTVNNATLVWGGTPNGGRQNVAFDTSVPGALKLIVTGTPSAALFWTGTPGSTWDSGDPLNPASGAANWRNGASADRFVKYDAVTFDDTLVNGTTVLSGNVEPASVLVNNTTKAVTINSSAGTITGGTSLIKSGTGTLTLQGANTYSGGTRVTGGTLAITSAASAGSGPISFENAGFTISALKPPNALSFHGTNTISGGSTGGLAGIAAITGDGLVNLNITTGVFDLTGDLGNFSGTLRIVTGNGMRMVGSTGGPGMTLDLGESTGSLTSRLGAPSIQFGALSGGASTILRGASDHGILTTYTIGAKNLSTTFAGSIRNGTYNAASLTSMVKTGSGTFTLQGTNPYSGTTLVNQGTLKVNGSLDASALTVAEGAILAGTGTVFSATVSSDAILSPGDGGPGVLTFTNGLTLAPESVTAFDLGSTRDRVDVTGNLTLNGIINFTNTGGLLPGTYTIFHYTGTLGGSGLAIGSVPADFACTLDTATGGQVKVVVTSTLSAFQQWQVLWFGSYNHPDAAAGADPDGDGQTNNDEFIAGTIPTSAASVSTLVWRGDGATNLWNASGAANFWNGNRLSTFTNGNPVLFDASGSANPTVNLSGTLSPASVSVNNTSAFTFAGTGGLAGTCGFNKSGTGVLTVQNVNAHAGTTTINAGGLVVGSASALGGASGGTTVATGSALGFAGGISYSIAEPVSGAGVGITSANNGVFVAGSRGFIQGTGGSSSFPGPVRISAAGISRIGVQDGADLDLSGPVTLAEGVSGVTLLIRAGLDGDFVTLSGTGNHWDGNTQIFSGATSGAAGLRLGTDNALPVTTSVVAGGNSTGAATVLDLNGKSQTLNGLIESNGWLRIRNTSGTTSVLTLHPGVNRTTVSGNNPTVIEGGAGMGTIALVKSGSFSQTLTGNNTYSGTTTISGGTLLVTGSIARSATTVLSPGTLGGTGTTGSVTVELGGTLAPGVENTGTLATGPFTLKSGSNSIFQLGLSSDRVNVTGPLALGGSIKLADTGSAIAGSYTLFSHTGLLTGSASVTPPPGFAAVLDTSAPGLVKVVLTASSYATWARGVFTAGELADPLTSGPTATPAGDGLSNLLKYALGLPPKTPSIAGITFAKPSSAWLFTYNRPANRPDLTYRVEISSSLSPGSWSSEGVVHQRIATGEPETWQGSSSSGNGTMLFWRLKVSMP